MNPNQPPIDPEINLKYTKAKEEFRIAREAYYSLIQKHKAIFAEFANDLDKEYAAYIPYYRARVAYEQLLKEREQESIKYCRDLHYRNMIKSAGYDPALIDPI